MAPVGCEVQLTTNPLAQVIPGKWSDQLLQGAINSCTTPA
jgi:hypothetical protein